MEWPKKQITWIEDRTLYISVPFTWCLPEVKTIIQQRSFFWNSVIVGGPAIYLMPDYLAEIDYVSVGHNMDGVLQRVNPMATRTTIGCIRSCKFCGVRKFEGDFKELEDWPNLPIICDNNLLAASQKHFDKVIDRLVKWEWADFNQGLDSRLLTEYHAGRLSRIKKPIIRLALDSIKYIDAWVVAFEKLIKAGIAKTNIRSYAIVGFDSDPSECWTRCELITKQGIKVLPMWYHALDTLEKNIVTKNQTDLGWNDYERKRIMGWYYKHRGEKK
uniref:Radical SAM superfamily protein n=1 Tax=viral metagenome TaxID=1070528 RepID=A0A6M3KXY2_9ZZZZ